MIPPQDSGADINSEAVGFSIIAPMAKALRTDLIDSPRWAELVRAARHRMDAFIPEKCPNCEVRYTVLLVVLEDAEQAVTLLRNELPKECPEHKPELYTINEGRHQGQIVVEN
jgi:hypothetical protein